MSRIELPAAPPQLGTPPKLKKSLDNASPLRTSGTPRGMTTTPSSSLQSSPQKSRNSTPASSNQTSPQKSQSPPNSNNSKHTPINNNKMMEIQDLASSSSLIIRSTPAAMPQFVEKSEDSSNLRSSNKRQSQIEQNQLKKSQSPAKVTFETTQKSGTTEKETPQGSEFYERLSYVESTVERINQEFEAQITTLQDELIQEKAKNAVLVKKYTTQIEDLNKSHEMYIATLKREWESLSQGYETKIKLLQGVIAETDTKLIKFEEQNKIWKKALTNIVNMTPPQ